MINQADEFCGFSSLDVWGNSPQVTRDTVGMLRTTLKFMDSQGRSPTNRKSLDVLSSIDSIRLGDALAARMFAHRALSVSEGHATFRVDEERLYTAAQLRCHLEATLIAASQG